MIHIIVTDRTVEVSGWSADPGDQKDMVDHTVYTMAHFFAYSLAGVTGHAEAILKCEDHLFLLDRGELDAEGSLLEKVLLYNLSLLADVYADYVGMEWY